MLSKDGSPRLSRSWRRKRDQPSNKLTTIYEDGMVDFDSRNRQRWALLVLLSIMVLCGMEGTDFRALNSKKGRRQDTPSGSNQTSWEYEADSSRPGKRRSIFRRPIGISLKAIARLEDLPGDEDISNEFETISPIRLHHIPKPSKNAVTTINLDEQAVSTEQHHDVLSAIHSVLPPQESKKPLESHWGAYQSFYKDPTWLELMPTGSEPLIPTFWHIPKTGGSTIKAILGNCHFKRMASEVGVLHGHGKDGKIEVVHIPDQIEHTLHVNVDVTTFSGLQRAASLGLVSSGAVEVIATPLLWDAALLFQSTNTRGKVFSMFRDPISRAVSMFAYLQGATHEPTYQANFANWTLEDYATSNLVEDNFMTRQLANTPPKALLDKEGLATAKAVVCQKILVGLLDRLEESLERFERFFAWVYTANPTHQETCRNSLLANGVNMNASPQNTLPSIDSAAYKALAERNRFDMELYKFVKKLYNHQASYIQSIPVDIRLINATCSMCHDSRSLRRT